MVDMNHHAFAWPIGYTSAYKGPCVYCGEARNSAKHPEPPEASYYDNICADHHRPLSECYEEKYTSRRS